MDLSKYTKNEAMIISWLGNDPRAFSVAQIERDAEARQRINELCLTLVGSGFLEKHGNKWGWFRLRQTDLEEMDLESEEAQTGPSDIWLPFDLSDWIEVYPGNILIFAGAKDSGKTALSLNVAQQNRHTWDVRYLNSEMGESELRKRVDLSDITVGMWKEGCTFYRRASNFADAILSCSPDKSMLFIIDFLEIHDEFYKSGATLKEIHDSLNGAVCIVNLQKNPGLETPPLGGWRSLEVCRLCVSVDFQIAKIKIAKNWRDPDPENNPRNKVGNFKLYAGYKITGFTGWHKEGDE